MNKLCYLIIMFITCGVCNAQVLCIYCYDQNDTVSSNVNNLLLNGGFENGTCIPWPSLSSYFCPNSQYYSCDITNWTCTGGGYYTYTCLIDTTGQWARSIIVEGGNSVYFGNNFCTACSFVQEDTACLNEINCRVDDLGIPVGYPINPNPGYGGTTGVSLEQTVNGLVIGNTYVLEFWTGGEAYLNGSFANRGLFAVDVGFGNNFLKDKGTPPTIGIGTRYIIEFNATSSSHTIKFTNWGHICGSCTELVLDDVRLYTLAELDASVPHCTVGIANSNLQNQENIFPNPVTSEFNVKTSSTGLSEVIVYDITSRKLLHQSFKNSTTINTEHLAKGIYLYEVRNRNGVIKKRKVVKE